MGSQRKLVAAREPVSNYRRYKKEQQELLFAEFVIQNPIEKASNKIKPDNKYSVIELFACAGGLAVGMEKAG